MYHEGKANLIKWQEGLILNFVHDVISLNYGVLEVHNNHWSLAHKPHISLTYKGSSDIKDE